MKKLSIGILGTVAAICLAVFFIIPFVAQAGIVYGGQEVFPTQEDYEEFKQDFKYRIYEDDLKLDTFDVLASEPPIIVNFAVTVPYNYDMPYGKTYGVGPQIFAAVVCIIASVFFFIILPIGISAGKK